MPRKASGEPKTKRVERRQANGSVYIYEVTTLYNPVKRYNEHVSSKLLGKKAADGSIISTRPRKSSADAVLTASRKTVGVTDILYSIEHSALNISQKAEYTHMGYSAFSHI